MQAELSKELHAQTCASIERGHELTKKRVEGGKELWKQSDEIVLNSLLNLQNVGVDMTQFLCTSAGRDISSNVPDRTRSLL